MRIRRRQLRDEPTKWELLNLVLLVVVRVPRCRCCRIDFAVTSAYGGRKSRLSIYRRVCPSRLTKGLMTRLPRIGCRTKVGSMRWLAVAAVAILLVVLAAGGLVIAQQPAGEAFLGGSLDATSAHRRLQARGAASEPRSSLAATKSSADLFSGSMRRSIEPTLDRVPRSATTKTSSVACIWIYGA